MATQVDLSSASYGWKIGEISSQDQTQDGLSSEVLTNQGSISFGRFAVESLSWEKRSVFDHNKRKEELDKLTCPGLVAQKKAYFEEYYKKKALEENNELTENCTENLEANLNCDPLVRNCTENGDQNLKNEFLAEVPSLEKSRIENLEEKLNNDGLRNSSADVSTSKEANPAVKGDLKNKGKILGKYEKEKKLVYDFDCLRNQWQKLKNRMFSSRSESCVRRKQENLERERVERDEKRKLTLALKRSDGRVKESAVSLSTKRLDPARKPQINNLVKNPKIPLQEARNLNRISQAGSIKPLKQVKPTISSNNHDARRLTAPNSRRAAPSLNKEKNAKNLQNNVKKAPISTTTGTKRSETKSKVLPSRPIKSTSLFKREAPVSGPPKPRSHNVRPREKPLTKSASDKASKSIDVKKENSKSRLRSAERSIGLRRLSSKETVASKAKNQKVFILRTSKVVPFNGMNKAKGPGFRQERPPWR